MRIESTTNRNSGGCDGRRRGGLISSKKRVFKQQEGRVLGGRRACSRCMRGMWSLGGDEKNLHPPSSATTFYALFFGLEDVRMRVC